MAEDWTSITHELPPIGVSFIASIKHEKSFYSEFLILEKNGCWSYRNGNKLEEYKRAVGWMNAPSS